LGRWGERGGESVKPRGVSGEGEGGTLTILIAILITINSGLTLFIKTARQ
jgi:hypothetical protein